MMNILSEEHLQHHLIGFLWQVGQEQDLVGRLFRYSSSTSSRVAISRSTSKASCRSSSNLLALLLLLLLWLSFRLGLLGPLLECSLHFSNDVRICFGILDPL